MLILQVSKQENQGIWRTIVLQSLYSFQLGWIWSKVSWWNSKLFVVRSLVYLPSLKVSIIRSFLSNFPFISLKILFTITSLLYLGLCQGVGAQRKILFSRSNTWRHDDKKWTCQVRLHRCQTGRSCKVCGPQNSSEAEKRQFLKCQRSSCPCAGTSEINKDRNPCHMLTRLRYH